MHTQAAQAYAQGKYETALQKYSQLITQQPDNAHYYLNRAVVHQTIFELPEAQQDLLKAIELQPTLEPAYKLLATVYRKTNKPLQAKEILMKAVGLFPQSDKIKEMLVEADEAAAVSNEETYVDMMLAKVCRHPQVRQYIKEESFLTKLEMLIRNPSILNQLVKQDSRLVAAYDAMLAERDD